MGNENKPSLFDGIGSSISSFFGNMAQGAGSAISGVTQNVTNSIGSGISGAFNNVMQGMEGGGKGFLKDWLGIDLDNFKFSDINWAGVLGLFTLGPMLMGMGGWIAIPGLLAVTAMGKSVTQGAKDLMSGKLHFDFFKSSTDTTPAPKQTLAPGTLASVPGTKATKTTKAPVAAVNDHHQPSLAEPA